MLFDLAMKFISLCVVGKMLWKSHGDFLNLGLPVPPGSKPSLGCCLEVIFSALRPHLAELFSSVGEEVYGNDMI
jgi:hypothetical protein